MTGLSDQLVRNRKKTISFRFLLIEAPIWMWTVITRKWALSPVSSFTLDMKFTAKTLESRAKLFNISVRSAEIDSDG